MNGPVLWEWLTWEEVGALRDRGMDMAILPVGSTEQHGPHLSLNVDTLSADGVARAVSRRGRAFPSCPPCPTARPGGTRPTGPAHCPCRRGR